MNVITFANQGDTSYTGPQCQVHEAQRVGVPAEVTVEVGRRAGLAHVGILGEEATDLRVVVAGAEVVQPGQLLVDFADDQTGAGCLHRRGGWGERHGRW